MSEVKTKFNFAKWVKANRTNLVKYGSFLAIIIIFTILTQGKIFKSAGIKAILRSTLPLIVIGSGTALVYACGNDDFAVGGVVGFVAIIMMILFNAFKAAGLSPMVSFIILVPICMVLGALFYMFVWTLIKKFNLSPVFASLSVMFILRGIGGAIIDGTLDADGVSTTKITDTKGFLKLCYTDSTLPIVVAVVVAVFTTIFMNYYILGKRNKAIADNALSATQSGTNVNKTTFIAYTIAGCCVGLGAILYGCMKSTPQVDAAVGEYGKEYLIECLVAIILGGMPVTGGTKSRISAVVIGAFTLRILYTGLNIWLPMSPLKAIGTATAYQFIEGIIFLALVTMVIRQPKHIKALPA